MVLIEWSVMDQIVDCDPIPKPQTLSVCVLVHWFSVQRQSFVFTYSVTAQWHLKVIRGGVIRGGVQPNYFRLFLY